jgi:hypothetical protein
MEELGFELRFLNLCPFNYHILLHHVDEKKKSMSSSYLRVLFYLLPYINLLRRYNWLISFYN